MKSGTKNSVPAKPKMEASKQELQKLMEMPCGDCGGQIRRKAITQEFEREGVAVKISGFLAWSCSRCGEIYFSPGGADRFAQAVNALFALAIVEKQHKGKVRATVA